MQEIISFIVPLYKGGKYVDHIIEIISDNANRLAYDFPNIKVEIVFVNDYPEEEIPRFESNIIDIHFLENEKNYGIHYSRIKGIKRASGEYIVFLDQDDDIDRRYLLSQMEIMKKYNADYVVANGYIQHSNYIRKIYKNKFMISLIKNPLTYCLIDNRIVSPGQCLIKRKIIPELWMKNQLLFNGADDLFLWILILDNGYVPTINYDLLYTHNRTENNASSDEDMMHNSIGEVINILGNINYRKDYIELLRYRNDYFSRNIDKSSYKLSYLSKKIIEIFLKFRVKRGKS